ncbi:hypothetical protein HMPREF2852_06670 [Anaerococcus sp. HMSC065G05]|uniref:hypothetical protein n=1 Tax=Anaerococcus sp. HMSC065G05 TaxID=1739356 RepID=UPI0008A168A0|nr:hypothetical protein [Anaerococcus sp. HMSC065G05]OFJ69708.1 hypothetical protein HMPREF2852_06670 [Anaerococcus sp. HMSC065G05]
MNNSIKVKVSDLYEIVKQLKDDNMDTVNLIISGEDLEDEEYDEEDSYLYAPALSFQAFSKSSEFAIDYDPIDSVE